MPVAQGPTTGRELRIKVAEATLHLPLRLRSANKELRMLSINNKTLILIIFAAIIIADFGFAGEALATYCATGTLISTNLLSGQTVTSISSFFASTTLPSANTTLYVQFATSSTSGPWYDAQGNLNGTTSIANGTSYIYLTGLGWSGPNFYYKMYFNTTDTSNTPVLEEIRVYYNISPPEVSTLAASGVGATSAIFNGNITGGTSITVRGFEYGISTSSVATTSESGSFGTGTFSLIATDLVPEEIYYFRAFATNVAGTDYGDWEQAAASRGCNPPTSGDFTITQSCTFPGFVNGAEEQNGQDGEGDIIIEEGVTLTINCGKDIGQTIVWNPGSKVIINGSIAICKGAGMTGGQLRKSHLWMIDSDDDTYSASITQYASLDAPSGDHKRRFIMATTTNVDCSDSSGYVYRLVAGLAADGDNDNYISGATGTQCVGEQEGDRYRGTDGSYSWLDGNESLGSDTNDSNDCIDTTTHTCCDDTNPTDGPDPKTAGEQALPACQRCDGVSIDEVNVTDNTGDSEGSNLCDTTSGDCYRCLSGSCTYQTAEQDLFNECAQGTTADDGCSSDNCSGTGYACGVQTSGDGGCPVCGTCTDSDIACEYHTASTYDSGCSQCYGCSGSEVGSCTQSTTTHWGAGTYGCTGSTNRCYSTDGCVTCGGYLYADGCSGCAGQGGDGCWYEGGGADSCDTACGSRGCVGADWNDDTSCSLCKTVFGYSGFVCKSWSNPRPPSRTLTAACYYRVTASQECSYPSPGQMRFCVCNY